MPAALLNDTLSFLAFLHAHDIRPRGSRWLPPSALAALNSQLLIRDQVGTPSRPQGGRIGTVERNTERIRFVHFLCEAAHLVAKTGAYLKPTLRATRWLAAEPSDQLHQLFVAAYPDQPSRPLDELWRTYRLPGWSLASPTVWLTQLFAILRAAPPGERIKLTTLLKLAPPEDGDEQPDEILRGVLHYLEWLGVVVWHGPAALQVNQIPIPSDCLARSARSVPMVLLPASRLRLELLNANFSRLYELSDYADLIAVTPVRGAVGQRPVAVQRRYRLNRDHIQRALQRGRSLDAILRFLENTLGDALPTRLVQQLHDWAAPLERVAVRRVTLLEVKDPATLTDLTRSHRVRESIQRTLSPRAVVVRDSRLPALLRQLAKHGLTPRTNLPTTQLSDYSTTRRFDSPFLAQLYFAALLNQQLADWLPAPYRVDYSIALDLARQLTPHDQLLAAELAQEAVEMLTAQPSCPNASIGHPGSPTANHVDGNSGFPLETRGNDNTRAAAQLESILALIEQSIAAHTPLVMRYYTAGRDAQTDRVVEPLRLEWRGAAYAPGDVPYLIAYCRLRQAERVFRVDRIVEISQAE